MDVVDAQTAPVPGPPGNCTADIRRSVGWGVATAAYQVEGAWNESGRNPSVWDTFTHNPRPASSAATFGYGYPSSNNATGDVADDMYHKYPEDFALMKSFGMKHYRFSFSWNRIVPQGFANTPVNDAGVAFYNSMLDEMDKNGITPYATIFHWDLPQSLQDAYEGFIGDRLVDDYVFYAETLFKLFGKRIKYWITFNEPWVTCQLHYGTGQFAPGIPYGLTGQYHCGHHLLQAHVRTVKIYHDTYKPQVTGGMIGITLNIDWGEPFNASDPADVAAAKKQQDWNLGWFANPIWHGDYPEVMRTTLNSSVLPSFTADEKNMFLTYKPEFQGINHYTSVWVKANSSELRGYSTTQTDGPNGQPIGPRAQSVWLYVVPWGLYKELKYVWEIEWFSVPGENDMTVPLPALRDTFRIDYYNGYIDSVCKAVSEGVKLTRYFAWSLMDNFEWNDGYSVGCEN
eukprot:jgi/Chrzof1/4249/Cz14g04230.t1